MGCKHIRTLLGFLLLASSSTSLALGKHFSLDSYKGCSFGCSHRRRQLFRVVNALCSV
jgi:hypothetical protein